MLTLYPYPTHPSPPPLGFGVYAPSTPFKGKKKVIPRAQQNRISAQRVRDKQKAYETFLTERVTQLEDANKAILDEINALKHTLGLATPPCPDSPQSLSDTDTISTSSWDDDVDSMLSMSTPLSLCTADTDCDSTVASPASTCFSGLESVEVDGALESYWAALVTGRVTEHSCESAVLATPLPQEALVAWLTLLLLALWTAVGPGQGSTWARPCMRTTRTLSGWPSACLRRQARAGAARGAHMDRPVLLDAT